MAFRYIWYTGYPALTDILIVQTFVKVTVKKPHWVLSDGLDSGGVGKGASRLGHAAAQGYGVGVGKAAGGITFIAATFPQVQGV